MKEQAGKSPAEIRDQASKERDLGIYKSFMDVALNAKAKSIMPYFGTLPERAVIVDAGSGTGSLAELIANYMRCMRVNVFALDVSHELLEAASDNRALAKLIFGDASVKNFPDNTVDIKYYSTSGHEIESFGTKNRKMVDSISATFQELKPGGKIIIRDFAKPETSRSVYMQILTSDGTDNLNEATKNNYLDYSALSKKALFLKFHQEFRNGNAFEYEIVNINGQEFIKLDSEWAHEFYLRKDYTANWRQEILEKYTYWNPKEAEEKLEIAGYEDIKVVPDPNEYILNNRLKGKIGLFEMNKDGKLNSIEFPSTHMIVVGTKPKNNQTEKITDEEKIVEKVVDYQKLLDSISYNEESKILKIGEHAFPVGNGREPILGNKKAVYQLLNEPNYVLKTVIPRSLNTHAVFKAMYQAIARESVLDQFQIPHLKIAEVDPQGPPYRYFVQQKIPENSISAVRLIANNSLSETDIKQMAEYINTFELNKKWQMDTNPFNWYRIPQDDGSTKMVYADGKVYLYDENWEFRRIGLLQWINPKYVEGNVFSAVIPTANEYQLLQGKWDKTETEQVLWWKKYLHQTLQPK